MNEKRQAGAEIEVTPEMIGAIGSLLSDRFEIGGYMAGIIADEIMELMLSHARRKRQGDPEIL